MSIALTRSGVRALSWALAWPIKAILNCFPVMSGFVGGSSLELGLAKQVQGISGLSEEKKSLAFYFLSNSSVFDTVGF